MTHHNRWGGRAAQFILMIGLIGLNMALIFGYFLASAYFLSHFEINKYIWLVGAHFTMIGGVVLVRYLYFQWKKKTGTYDAEHDGTLFSLGSREIQERDDFDKNLPRNILHFVYWIGLMAFLVIVGIILSVLEII